MQTRLALRSISKRIYHKIYKVIDYYFIGSIMKRQTFSFLYVNVDLKLCPNHANPSYDLTSIDE